MVPAYDAESLRELSSTEPEPISRVHTVTWNMRTGNACALYRMETGINLGDRDGIFKAPASHTLPGESSGGKRP